MKKAYITIVGTQYRYGSEFLEPGMKVRLAKEPENEHDREAIRVEMEGLGRIGYVANSWRTALGESMSAGRLYDKIGDTAEAVVLMRLNRGVVCTVPGVAIPDPEQTRPEDGGTTVVIEPTEA